MKQHEENRIWDYVDGLLTGEEYAETAVWISSDPAAVKFMNEITFLKTRLEKLGPEAPSAAFTMNVLGAWAAETGKVEPLKSHADGWIIKGIVFAFLGLILGLIAVVIFFGGAGHKAQHVSDAYAYTSSNNIIRLLGNKLVLRSFLIAEVLLLLFFADKFFKRFTLNEALPE